MLINWAELMSFQFCKKSRKHNYLDHCTEVWVISFVPKVKHEHETLLAVWAAHFIVLVLLVIVRHQFAIKIIHSIDWNGALLAEPAGH